MLIDSNWASLFSSPPANQDCLSTQKRLFHKLALMPQDHHPIAAFKN